MPETEGVRDLFARLEQDGESVIVQMRARRQQENVELEFKTKRDRSKPSLDPADRENLATALSAFSNSIGGTLIWGVHAAKNKQGIDCVRDLKSISHIERFKSEIAHATPQAIMPRHEGIRLLTIPCSTDPNSGYLAVQVERSERRPHRCEFGNRQYFKRIVDNSVAMEHYDIEDAFKRLAVPSLEVEHLLSDGGHRDSFRTMAITLSLKNVSNVSAAYPYLKLESATTGVQLSRRILRNLREPSIWSGGADDVIHPDLSTAVLELSREFWIQEPNYLPRGGVRDTIIEVRCGCLHSRPKFTTITITEEQIAAALNLQLFP